MTSKPIRVAYVVHSFEVGGLERCVARLVNHLARPQFQPMIVCLARNGDAAAWIEADDVPVVALEKPSGNSLSSIRLLAREFGKHEIDVVHSHNWGTLLETCLARRRADIPCHVHAERGMSSVLDRGLRARLRGRVTRWALNRTDAVIAVSESVRRSLAGRCGRLKRDVRVIPNGVDAPAAPPEEHHRNELRARLGITPEALVVGSVGRLARIKEFGTAIDAVGELARSGRDTHLLLIGDGPEKDRLIEHVRAAGLQDRIHLAGQQEDVGTWLASMDVYVNVSRNEGMSQSILEAMAVGLPMVVTDVGESPVLVGGEASCGLVVAPGNPGAVAEAVHRIDAGSELRRELACNARARYAASYGVERMIRTYEDLYKQLVLSGRQRS